MQYRRSDYSFDWKGFKFFLAVAFICLLTGSAAHYGPSYAVSFIAPPTPLQPIPLAPLFGDIAYSSTTPKRVINTLTIKDATPSAGKFIAADLVDMKLYLYEDGAEIAEYPITKKGRPGTAWETPSGFYSVQTKEEEHFSSIGRVYMPYSMQFYGNYFLHGHTYYPDGTPTSATFSGGCIRLGTEDAKKVFEFAEIGTKLFVYDSKQSDPPPPLALERIPMPPIAAQSYLVADLDTGDVYMERNAGVEQPIASATKLMTALVANETISFDKVISVPEGGLVVPPDLNNTASKVFAVENLLYPLLMLSSDAVAEALASYYGSGNFVRWMNTTARALNMRSTEYADASGVSPGTTSTPDDLFRLAVYLANKKSFVLKIVNTENKTITSEDGSPYEIENMRDAVLSVLTFPVGEATRRVAIIVLGSNDRAQDATHLAEWITNAARESAHSSGTACASCAEPPLYRKIEL